MGEKKIQGLVLYKYDLNQYQVLRFRISDPFYTPRTMQILKLF